MRELYVFNVHNDFKSRSNRLKTSNLILNRIEEVVPEGVASIVMGDFNAPASFQELSILTDRGFQVLKPNGSTNRVMGINLLPAIDHILVDRANLMGSEIRVWRNKFNGEYPSDHYPISAAIEFKH